MLTSVLLRSNYDDRVKGMFRLCKQSHNNNPQNRQFFAILYWLRTLYICIVLTVKATITIRMP